MVDLALRVFAAVVLWVLGVAVTVWAIDALAEEPAPYTSMRELMRDEQRRQMEAAAAGQGPDDYRWYEHDCQGRICRQRPKHQLWDCGGYHITNCAELPQHGDLADD